jgi:hypothetical protein
MFTIAFFSSWLAYLVITFALGFIWHLVVFRSLYRRLGIYTRIDDPIIPLGLLAMLIQGAVLAYLYPLVADGAHPARDGILFGLLLGLFMASSAVIAEAAKQRVTSLRTWFAVESTYYAIQFTLAGLAIGFINTVL